MINCAHIYKTYPGPTHALKNVSIEIEKGEFAFLIGPSGAGKTTLFRMLAAYDRPTSGSVSVAGYDLNAIKNNEVPYYRRHIGVVYQDFRLLRGLTVFENVALPLEIRAAKNTYIQSRVNEILEQVGLGHKSRQFPEQLSGGEQQRVAIARALVHYPDLLIADEPTGNLDPQLSEDIMDLLEKVNAQGTTVFVATHNHAMVEERSKRVLSLVGGELRQGLYVE